MKSQEEIYEKLGREAGNKFALRKDTFIIHALKQGYKLDEVKSLWLKAIETGNYKLERIIK